MAVHLLVLGLIGAVSGLLAVVASRQVEPFYSQLLQNIPSVNIQYVPHLKVLYSARQAVRDNRTVRIRDGYRRELHAIHQVLIEELDYDEQFYPIELSFTHNSIQLQYADNRKQGTRGVSKSDLVSLIDDRISEAIGRISAYAAVIGILAFTVLIILAANRVITF